MTDTLELNTELPHRRRRPVRAQPVLALTVLAHPDPKRVGARAWPGKGGVEISRAGPVFEDGEPLRDRFLSRRPVLIHRAGAAGLTLSTRETSTKLVVDGRNLEGTLTLAWDRVDRGVVLELAERITLLLIRRAPAQSGPALGLLGVSAAAERIRREILQVADLTVPVLVRGESGVGKERVAQALHAASPRSAGPCVAVNMATVPPTLAASELFGHVKGAFSGAGQAREGHFARADGGTLFLDEVGDTPQEVQPMLLRALETGEIQPVGGNTPQVVDVRVVSATDAELEKGIAEGRFRAPLLHRLAGFHISIPPLRERPEDVGVLATAFAAEVRVEVGDPPEWGLPAGLVAAWARHPWPGNVRALRNAVRQVVILNRGREEMEWEAPEATPAPSAAPGRKAGELEGPEILEAIEAEGGIKQAAAALGVSRAALYRRMEKLGLERP